MSFARTYQYGWRYHQLHAPMRPNQGSTLTGTVTSVAIALVTVLAVATALALVEARSTAPRSVAGWLSIPRAHAATAPSAPLLILSHRMPFVLTPGEEMVVRFGFKNMSGRSWVRSNGSAAILARADESRPSAFVASSWIDTLYVGAQDDATVPQGAIAYLTVRFRAPQAPGTVTETFALRSLDGTRYAGAAVDVTITTTAAAPTAAAPTAVLAFGGALSVYGPGATLATGTDGTDPNFIALTPRYTEQPVMRVGIVYHEPEDAAWIPHRVTAPVPLRVTTENGSDVVTVPAGTTVAVDYRPGDATYHVRAGTDWYTVAQPVRISATAPGLLELASYMKKLRWEGNQPDNHFRGIMEIRYVPETERLWAINELPLEDYLRGLTETSDDAPYEFHKAQVIAARTYALYHIETGGKYTKGQFVLTGTASDQVYRGEDAAARRPNLVRAVEDTRGVVMTYDGDVVVTPYFAQSNGQTLAYNAVWGGKPKAWLAGTTDPVCDGKRKIGHGVGMPQRCAMELANDGWSFGAILKLYYQNIELRKLYE